MRPTSLMQVKVLVVFGAVLLVPVAPARADKLVVFRNGKALRVKAVKEEGRWLRCEFEDKNFLSVPTSVVASIEEAAVGSRDGDLRPNQVAAGSAGSYTGPRGGGQVPEPVVSQEIVSIENPDQSSQDEMQAALAEEAQAVQRGANRGIPGRGRGGVGQQPGQAVQGNPAFQPANQGNPFPGREGRTGLRQRGSFDRGRTQVPEPQVQSDTQAGNN